MKKLLFLFSLFAIANALNAQIIVTYAGNGTAGFSGNGGQAKAAKLSYPSGVTVDPAGNVYIADRLNHMVRKVNTAGVISTVAGTGVAGFSGDGGQATAAKIHSPSCLYLDSAGNMYISDNQNNRIRKVTPSGIITTVAGNGVASYSGDGGQATDAAITEPWNVCMDRSGNLYILDGLANEVVRKVAPSGIITTFAGNGTGGYSGDGGQATNAELADPSGIRVDSLGNVYIADCLNHCVRKVNTAGIISTIAGNGTPGYGGDGGPATLAQMNSASDIAFAPDGTLYISDESNGRIRKVTTSGIITTIAGNGTPGYGGDGGPATAGELNLPFGIAVDPYGNIFSVDQQNFRVREIIMVVHVCMGDAKTINTDITGGRWVSTNSSIASIGSLTGTVTGIASGTSTIYHIVGVDTAIVPVYVDTLPTPGTITGADSVCPGAVITLHSSVAGGTWSITNTSLGTVTSTGSVTGILSGPDTVIYKVTNAAGCISEATFAIKVRSAALCKANIAPVPGAMTDAIKVFPNPSPGNFNIQIPAVNESTSVSVYDLYGRLLLTDEIAANSSSLLLSLSGAPAGIYLLEVKNTSWHDIRKIILE